MLRWWGLSPRQSHARPLRPPPGPISMIQSASFKICVSWSTRITELPSADQIVHHPGQAHNIGRVQTDGRLVQHIENARCAVADGAGQLHPLALAGGERRRRSGPASDSPVPDPSAAWPCFGMPRRCSPPSGASPPAGCRARPVPTPPARDSVMVQASSREMPAQLRRAGRARTAAYRGNPGRYPLSEIFPRASCPFRP